MAYTPPAYNAVDFNSIDAPYTPPAYNAVNFGNYGDFVVLPRAFFAGFSGVWGYSGQISAIARPVLSVQGSPVFAGQFAATPIPIMSVKGSPVFAGTIDCIPLPDFAFAGEIPPTRGMFDMVARPTCAFSGAPGVIGSVGTILPIPVMQFSSYRVLRGSFHFKVLPTMGGFSG